MLTECLKSVLLQRERVWGSCPCSSVDGGWQLQGVIWKCHHKCKTFHHEIYGGGIFDMNVKASLSEPLFYEIFKTTDSKLGDISALQGDCRHVLPCFWNAKSCLSKCYQVMFLSWDTIKKNNPVRCLLKGSSQATDRFIFILTQLGKLDLYQQLLRFSYNVQQKNNVHVVRHDVK